MESADLVISVLTNQLFGGFFFLVGSIFSMLKFTDSNHAIVNYSFMKKGSIMFHPF